LEDPPQPGGKKKGYCPREKEKREEKKRTNFHGRVFLEKKKEKRDPQTPWKRKKNGRFKKKFDNELLFQQKRKENKRPGERGRARGV